MKKKVLFVATVVGHIKKFHEPYLKWFKDNGYETHVAAKGEDKIMWCDKQFNVSFVRSPFSLKNIKATKQLKKIIDQNRYDLIHCHTPMGSVVTRIAAKKSRQRGTKVLYTAHGFHFFNGSPFINWLLFYPVEKLLASYTDGIITINKEDYNLLINKNFNTKGKHHIYGIGVNADKFHPVSADTKVELRKQLGYSVDNFILFYAAEFIERKNHKFLIKSVPHMAANIPNLKVILAGRGELMNEMKSLSNKLGVKNNVDFLGYRTDINHLLAISDVGVSTSKQEGLPINIIEALFTGLPIVTSVERGHNELVIDDYNGFRFNQNDNKRFIEYIIRLSQDKGLRDKFGQNSLEHAQKFHIDNSITSMAEIYDIYLS